MLTRRRRWFPGIALLGYAAMAFALFGNVWASPATRWIGVNGDPESTIWSIQWTAYALVHWLNPFLTNHIFYPAGTNVLWANADAPSALAWAAAPITLVFGPIVAYNLLQTLALALSAWCAYLAIRSYVNTDGAALAGGLVYGFGPYVMGQAYGHLALTFGVVPPLLLILLDRLVARRDLSALLIGAAAGLLEAFQLLVSEELVVTEAIVTLVGLAILGAMALVFRWRVPWRHIAVRLALASCAAIVVFGVLAAYPVYLLLFGPSRVTREPIRAFGTYVTDLLNVVVPPATTHLIHSGWTETASKTFPGGPVEAGGYLGIGLLAIILFTTLRWARNPAVLFGAGLVAVILLISLGPTLTYAGHHSHRIVLPWSLARDVPLLNEIQVVRLSLYIDLFAGLLLALFIDQAWRAPWRFARPATTLAAAAALVLLVPSVPWAASTAHVPSLFVPGTEANRYFHSIVPEGKAALVLPTSSLHPDTGYAVLWQASDGMRFKMLGGDLLHGGPDGVATYDPEPSSVWTAVTDLQNGRTPSDASGVGTQLQAWDVRAVVVGPMDHGDEAVLFFTAVFGRPPVDTGGVHLWPAAPSG